MFSHAEYAKLVEDTIAQINYLSTVKGGEYAGDSDRLANFRRNGDAIGVPMEVIWRVYAGKHWDSISQYIKDIAEGKDRPRAESMLGRFDDLIVYAILGKAIYLERERNKQSFEALAGFAGSLPIDESKINRVIDSKGS